ncbi:MAG TPA: hypothetical protein VHA13_01685 [Gammaproteobacteria bacterium]|nr:hypothetical protein [Gammaproteobacteria bacterium]
MHQQDAKQSQAFKTNEVFPHFVAAAFSTTIAHPIRVCLNRAPYHFSPLSVIKDLRHYWRSGLGINFTRGIIAITSQSWTKDQAQHLSQDHAKLNGMLAAALSGTIVASMFETILIRKNTLEGKNLTDIPLARFTPALSGAYFFRELAFSFIVLGSKETTPFTYYSQLLSLSFFTATFHKFAVWEATSDIVKKTSNNTVPNIAEDGFPKTIKNIANNHYTHPTCRGPIINPKTSSHALINIFSVSCGLNMLMWRTLHLWLLQNLYNKGLALAPIAKNNFSFWFGNKINKTDDTTTNRVKHKSLTRNYDKNIER